MTQKAIRIAKTAIKHIRTKCDYPPLYEGADTEFMQYLLDYCKKNDKGALSYDTHMCILQYVGMHVDIVVRNTNELIEELKKPKTKKK